MSTTFKYRADIDGLRAIAVSVVVLFHAGLSALQGGFVGVDVFFVISGFLITSLLVEEVQKTGTLSLSNFYARRVRRLMPAGLFVVMVTIFVGCFLYPADGERQALIFSGIAAILFVSNFYFWKTSGYFSASAEDMPLLHTWTLSVEEQFYVFWPLLILSIVWVARKNGWNFFTLLGVCFLGVSVMSFCLAQWMIHTRPSAAFYLVIPRAFELGMGAILALFLRRNLKPNLVFGTALSVAGLIGLIYSVLNFNATTAWPGPLSLITIFGTAAVLIGGRLAPQSLATRFLSLRPMVFVGKISYSWYLWHWPFLVFLHYYYSGETTWLQRGVAVFLSFLMAIFSYYCVEQPIRYAKDRRPFNSIKGSLLAGGVMIFATSLIGLGLYKAAQYELAESTQLQASVEAKKRLYVLPSQCMNYEAPFLKLAPWQDCVVPNERAAKPFVATDSGESIDESIAPRELSVSKNMALPYLSSRNINVPNINPEKIVLWGDSHVMSFTPALSYLTKEGFADFVVRTKAGCRPFDGPYLLVVPETQTARRDCERFNAAVKADLGILKNADFKQVWMVSRWPPAGTEGAELALWKDALLENVKYAKTLGYHVTLFSAPPQFNTLIPRCVSRRSAAECAPSRKDVTAIQSAQMEGLTYVSRQTGAEIISLFDLVCDAKTCFVDVQDDVILYKDDNHLSHLGAEWVAKQLLEQGLFSALSKQNK